MLRSSASFVLTFFNIPLRHNKIIRYYILIKINCFYLFSISAINIIFWFNQTTLLFQKQVRVLADARTNLSAHKHSLVINNVQAKDEGVYRCKVVPEDIELKTKLIVLTKPIARIYNGKEDVSDRSLTYSQGDTISLQCIGVGKPTPKIKWFTDGLVVEKVPGVHVKNNSLIINRADYHHVHVYQCLADNGSEAFHVTVTINIKRKLIQWQIAFVLN